MFVGLCLSREFSGRVLRISDLVFGRGLIQRVQLPAEFVQLIIDVVHLGTQALVFPEVGIKLSLIVVTLSIRCDLWVCTGGGEEGRGEISVRRKPALVTRNTSKHFQ